MRLAPHVSLYLSRSAQILRDDLSRMVRMSGADPVDRAPKTLLDFRTPDAVRDLAKGCDSDVGGLSTSALTLEADPVDTGVQSNGGQPYLRFWGEMRTDVRPEARRRLRGGYAGFRNQFRPALFGEMTWNVENHEYLALRVRAGGHPRTRHAYFVNLQTDGPVTTDIWQHRLHFRRTDGGWEDLFIPFSSFLLTNSGSMVSASVSMFKRRVRSVGVSLLGGNSGIEGTYELGIDSFRAVNRQDVVHHPEPMDETTPLEEPAVDEIATPLGTATVR